MLKAIACDDEQFALDLLSGILGKLDGIDLVSAHLSIIDAVETINRGGIDLAFLDIEMPDLTGVSAVSQITIEPKPLIVFVTAHSEYALDAFGVDAIDYVLKPIAEGRIAQSVVKADRLLKLIQRTPKKSEFSETELSEGIDSHKFLRILDGNRMYVLPSEDVVWIEAAGDYSLIHKRSGEIAVRRTLSSLADELDPDHFPRVHRSSIISVQAIQEIKRLSKGEAEIVMQDGSKLRASRSYKNIVSKLMA